MEHINYEIIEEIKNGHFYNTKYVPEARVFDNPHVVCFSNSYPDKTKLSADRWDIIDLALYDNNTQVPSGDVVLD